MSRIAKERAFFNFFRKSSKPRIDKNYDFSNRKLGPIKQKEIKIMRRSETWPRKRPKQRLRPPGTWFFQ